METLDTSAAVTGDGSAAGADAVTVRRAEGAMELPYAAVGEAEAAAMALSPAQRVAIQWLTSGRTAVDAAEAAGVGRTTLYRWLKEDAAFQAAYNAWQRDVIATTRARLLGLGAAAVTAVERAMSRGDGRLALRVLERLGLACEPTPGPTDPADVARGAEIDRRRVELVVRRAEVDLNEAEGQVELSALLASPLGGPVPERRG